MSGLVVDASVTMGWCFEDEATPALDAQLDQVVAQSATVPALWRLEVANVLLAAERRGRLVQAQSSRFVALLEQLPITVESETTSVSELISLGRTYELTAYDAEYLALAMRHALPLATTDAHLAAACRSAGVTLA